MKYIPAGVSIKLARQVLQFKKNSPAIMFGAGITTAAISTVLACKATLKLDEVIAEAETTKTAMHEVIGRPLKSGETYSEKDLEKDAQLLRVKTAVKIAKLYAPAVGVGLLSVGLLTGSHITLTRRNAAIASAYAVLDKGFNEYRSRVRGELGDEKDREFLYGAKLKEIVEEGEHGHEVKTVKQIDGSKYTGYARPFDKLNRHWSNHPGDNRNFIMNMQSWLNDKLTANGHVFLNDAYRALGYEDTKEGAVVGWVKSGKNKHGEKVGDTFIDFGLTSNDPRIDFFMSGDEGSVWLDFNVDGVVYDLI